MELKFNAKITNINLLATGNGTVQMETEEKTMKPAAQAAPGVPASHNKPDIVCGIAFVDSKQAAQFEHYGEYEIIIRKIEKKAEKKK